jgi:23S rRNA pseudouridine2457 synthase
MPEIILLNKPFNVLSQFTDEKGRDTLKTYLPNHPGFHAAGRLDFDSEGLLLLTNDGPLQHRITDPKHKLSKTYWVQIEGDITPKDLERLSRGVTLKDGLTRPAKAKRLPNSIENKLWSRTPPIRERKNIPTSWIELVIKEGKNRQVRRMTAAVGHPTLRLIRMAIGPWHLSELQPGQYNCLEANLPPEPATKHLQKRKFHKKTGPSHTHKRHSKASPTRRNT